MREPKLASKPQFRWQRVTGALVVDRGIEGLTQPLKADQAIHYGAWFFVGETMSKSAARLIAEQFGGELIDPAP